MRRAALLVLFLVSLAFASSPVGAVDAGPAPSRFPLATDPALRKNVEFWIGIYTQYDTSHGLIHDARYVDHVFEVVDVHAGHDVVRAAKRRWRAVLLSLHEKSLAMGQGKVIPLTPDEQKVYDMYRDVSEPDKFLAAANRKRLRFQLGQKDRFLEGLKASGQYLPYMEDIFHRAGLPVELTRIPLVESSFNLRARSKVGASGIWQFMRSTGKLFLRINPAVDERNDPIRATEAAAKLLELNYQSLRNWGLAVTAYNHGRLGIMRAVRAVGSEDIEDLVREYRSGGFGFASGNYFAALLAAIEVEKNATKYFGKFDRDPEVRFYEVRIPDYVSLPKLALLMKLDEKPIRALNPALSEAVFEGRLLLPAGYRLRLPEGPDAAKLPDGAEGRIFLAGYSEIPALYKFRRQKRGR